MMKDSSLGASSRDGQKPFAIVFSLDGMNGIQTARVLASRKFPVIGNAKDPEDFRCHTRVCDRILLAGNEEGGNIETLETLGPKLDRRAVLFLCSDINVVAVSRHFQRLEEMVCGGQVGLFAQRPPVSDIL